MFSTSMFTSCINGVDDEYLELQGSQSGGTDGEEEEEPLPDLNGDYFKGGDYELTMIYNGEELAGKKVTFLADDKNETATVILSGMENDLSSLIGGLLEFKFTSYSPIPGEKEITLTNLTLYRNGNVYVFKGEYIQPTYTMMCDGEVEEGRMKINITHQLVNQELAGTWNLAEAKAAGASKDYSPLWCDWDSNVIVSLGKVNVGFMTLPIDKYAFNGIFTLLTGAMSGLVMNSLIGTNIQVQPLIRNLLQGVTAQPDGCMFATYSYSGDFKNPEWSSEMPRNALRYYYGNPGQINLEVNADFLIGLLNGLINPVITRADKGTTIQLGQELIEILTPVLEKGIPCDYVLEGDRLTLNIDGQLLKAILSKLMELANDEFAHDFVVDFINSSLGDFGPNIMLMLETMPNALKYHDYDKDTDTYSGECGYVKLGLKFVKG